MPLDHYDYKAGKKSGQDLNPGTHRPTLWYSITNNSPCQTLSTPLLSPLISNRVNSTLTLLRPETSVFPLNPPLLSFPKWSGTSLAFNSRSLWLQLGKKKSHLNFHYSSWNYKQRQIIAVILTVLVAPVTLSSSENTFLCHILITADILEYHLLS